MLHNRIAIRYATVYCYTVVPLAACVLASTPSLANAQAEAPLPVFGLQFSPDGKFLAAASASGNPPGPVVLWNVGGWSTAAVVPTVAGCLDLDFTTDGRFLAYAGKDGSVGIIDVSTGKVIRTIEAHEGAVFSVAFLPEGNSLISAGADHEIHQWSAVTGELEGDFEGHTDTVDGVAVSPDGQTLVSGGNDKTVRVWDIASRKVRQTFQPSDLIVRRISFNRDGKYFLVSSWDGKTRIRETSTGSLRARLESASNCADITNDNRLVATVAHGSTAYVYSVQLDPPTAAEQTEIADCLATFTQESYAEREKAAQRILELGMIAEPQLREALTAEDAEVRVRARTLRNQVISPKWIAELPGHSGDSEVVDFSPDGLYLATGCRGGDVKVWDTATFQELFTFRLPLASVRDDE